MDIAFPDLTLRVHKTTRLSDIKNVSKCRKSSLSIDASNQLNGYGRDRGHHVSTGVLGTEAVGTSISLCSTWWKSDFGTGHPVAFGTGNLNGCSCTDW